MLLSICVQHHPSRPLSGALRRFEVVDDPEPDGKPSAIRTYIQCLRSMPPGVSHRLVLQDDVELVTNFTARAHHALSERPHDIVAFFVPGMGLHGKWVREAHASGHSWVAVPTSTNWQPTVALAWPRELAERFIPFAEEYVAGRLARRMSTPGDDPAVGKFVRAEKLAVWATVPCLVEHPDVGFSIVKRRTYKGTNPARKAAVFAAD